jgi:hypothetical protein
MNKYFMMASFVVFSSCAQTKPAVSAHSIRPGEIRIVEFPYAEKAKIFCRDQEVKIAKYGSVARAVVMESYFSDLTPFHCRVVMDGKSVTEMKFSVEDREYPAEMLKVDQKKIKLAPQDEKRVWEEQQVLNKIYSSSVPQFLFEESFMQPLSSTVTSIYGTKRIYNKEKKGQHLGIDYRAAIGDKVPAGASGKVVFAGDLFYTGWTVILDHGMDIFTVYGHLSKTMVKDGDMVKRGDLIGLSGNTGRTSGPHLHWGVKVQGQYIDGMVMISETKRFFKE